MEFIHNYHITRGWAEITYHYYVRRDGRKDSITRQEAAALFRRFAGLK